MLIFHDLRFKNSCFYGEYRREKQLAIFFSDGTAAVVLYRLHRFLKGVGLGLLGSFFLDLNKSLNGCVIGKEFEAGPGFVLMHPIGVVINGQVKAGKNLVIESGVVIGAARNGLPVRVPAIGDNVFIGAGAKVLGGIRIGNNVKIGANAVVVKDVPDNCTVVGVPGRIVN